MAQHGHYSWENDKGYMQRMRSTEYWGGSPLYYRYGPFQLLTSAMTVVAVLLVVVGLGCAAMYVADLAEEFPSWARATLKWMIVFNLVIHSLIALIDHLSWWRSTASLVQNVLYLRLLKTFPWVPGPRHPLTLGVFLGGLIETACWYWFSTRLQHSGAPTVLVISYFLFLWLVPLGLLASCVVESDQLPGASSIYAGDGTGNKLRLPSDRDGSPHRRTILKRVVEFLKDPAGD